VEEISTHGQQILVVAAAGAGLLIFSQLSERTRFPAPALFLLGAAFISNFVLRADDTISIDKVQLIAVIALIVIMFDGGMNVGWHRFRQSIPAIGLLGILGTAGTAAISTLFAHYLLGFPWILAGILGAALAPTDPAVILSVLRGWRIRGRTGDALAGELGVNDAVSISIVIGLIHYAQPDGGSFSVVLHDFALEMAVGFGIGSAMGAVLPWLLRHARFPAEGLYGIAALMAAATAYGAAAVLHGSGFLAAFIVGVMLGHERTPQKAEIEHFSRALATFSEMAVFAALGLTIDLTILHSDHIWLDGLLLAVLVICVARPAVVFPILSVLRLRMQERLFVAWAGVKGAAPILLAAIAVQAGFESERMYGIVFIVVLFSVMVQGTTVHLAAERLAIPGDHDTARPERRTHRYRVRGRSAAAGRHLRDLPIGKFTWVDSIHRDGRRFRPRGRERLRAGDEVVATSGDTASEEQVRRLLEDEQLSDRTTHH
jgi:cell volume regulation protein A